MKEKSKYNAPGCGIYILHIYQSQKQVSPYVESVHYEPVVGGGDEARRGRQSSSTSQRPLSSAAKSPLISEGYFVMKN
jgi:hypothetical protein